MVNYRVARDIIKLVYLSFLRQLLAGLISEISWTLFGVS